MNKIAGIYLFGSSARGDRDSSSDLDVLAVYDSKPSNQLRKEVLAKLFCKFGKRLTLAEYSVVRIKEMFSQGHLFAWHLFQEAKPLAVEGLCFDPMYNLCRPSPYDQGIADATRFIGLLDTIASEVEVDACSTIHEAGLTYLCLRNIAMSLSSLGAGRPDFTRLSPLNLSRALDIPPPCSGEAYNQLIQARHASQRGLPAPGIELNELRNTIASSIKWSNLIMRKADA